MQFLSHTYRPGSNESNLEYTDILHAPTQYILPIPGIDEYLAFEMLLDPAIDFTFSVFLLLTMVFLKSSSGSTMRVR